MSSKTVGFDNASVLFRPIAEIGLRLNGIISLQPFSKITLDAHPNGMIEGPRQDCIVLDLTYPGEAKNAGMLVMIVENRHAQWPVLVYLDTACPHTDAAMTQRALTVMNIAPQNLQAERTGVFWELLSLEQISKIREIKVQTAEALSVAITALKISPNLKQTQEASSIYGSGHTPMMQNGRPTIAAAPCL